MRVYKHVAGVVAVGLLVLASVSPKYGMVNAGTPGLTDSTACNTDLVVDGVINEGDLVAAVHNWGGLIDDAIIDAAFLSEVVASWGACHPWEHVMPAEGGGHVCAVEDDSFATADGGCKDLATGLVWSTNGMGHGVNFNWSTSMDFIEGSGEAGFTDWRPPTLNEWLEVIDNGAATHFGDGHSVTGGNRYWSGTARGQRAWAVVIATADSYLMRKANFLYFVGVREAAGPLACNDNGTCEPGENCENCNDCDGKTNGPPSGRFCCGDGVLQGPEGDGTICDGNP